LTETTVLVDAQTEEHFTFDRVFGQDCTQEALFEYTALPVIKDVLDGYNATIFAYGQTSSGKTYTMEGPDITDPNQKGIIPRTVAALFEGVHQADEDIEFTFKVTFIEIYMEKVRDLLDVNGVKGYLQVREDKKSGGKGVYISGCTEEYVTSVDDLLDIMATGTRCRSTAATGMNEGSSRSHSVFTITVQQRDTTNGMAKTGKLVLVDLAGSEMVRKTNASGIQLEEAKTINRSLSALGQVIYALTDDKSTHIPYRDSKLTRILQDSLGGNSKTVLIVAVSPNSYNVTESVSTLRFGMRAKNIRNVVVVNQTRSVEELETLLVRAEKAIDAQQQHIQGLTQRLEESAQLVATAAGPSDSTENAENGAPSTEEAAAALALRDHLQRQIDELLREVGEKGRTIKLLQSELDEERVESKRKGLEVNGLHALIREKEGLLREASDLMLEAQEHYEMQRDRAEKLSHDNIKMSSELGSVRESLKEEISKLRFSLQESELHSEKLRLENDRLSTELTGLSGDMKVIQAESERLARDQARELEDSRSPVSSPIATRKHGADASNAAGGEDKASDTDAVVEALDEEMFSSFLEALAQTLAGHKLTEEPTAAVSGLAREFARNLAGKLSGVRNRCEFYQKLNSSLERKLYDSDISKSKLALDVKDKTQKNLVMQTQVDHLRALFNKVPPIAHTRSVLSPFLSSTLHRDFLRISAVFSC
jgi:kinesin family protein 5